ncbi:MAG: acyltransferase [Victivallis sp.]|jgi:transferase hexapeptide repeat containing protein|uniref:acyltransferase n=1 Tax=uncultured Victivallis sp. TaxID=354118 RepID=UPI0025933C7F|nr:acyltransferase [uncultured Victivallis sp.]
MMIKHISYRLFWFKKALVTVSGTLLGTLRLYLWGAKLKGLVKCVGLPYVEFSPAGCVRIGRACCLRSARCSNIAGIDLPVTLGVLQKGKLEIGDQCGISASVIVAEESVIIGDRVMIGVNCRIADTDFHPLDLKSRAVPHSRGKTAPVVIGSDVFIGMNCIVLKGVSIGCGSVIAAGSVVTKSIPPHVMAGGNPARVLRSLGPE